MNISFPVNFFFMKNLYLSWHLAERPRHEQKNGLPNSVRVVLGYDLAGGKQA